MPYNCWEAIEPSFAPPYIKIFTYYFDGSFEEYGKGIFHEHNARVRSLAPKGKLLEYRISEGWEHLCKFLEVEVTKADFPNGNGAIAARAKIQRLCAEKLRGVWKRVLTLAWRDNACGFLPRDYVCCLKFYLGLVG